MRLFAETRLGIGVLAGAVLTGVAAVGATESASSLPAAITLTSAAAILLLYAGKWARRRQGVPPATVVALALFVYFPFRGLLLDLVTLGTGSGVNPRVSELLATNAINTSATSVLLISVGFVAGVDVLSGRSDRRPRTAVSQRDPPSSKLQQWGFVLIALGVASSIPLTQNRFDYLQGTDAAGGFVVQILQIMRFAAGAGMVMHGLRGAHARPARILVTVGLMIAIVSGSKDDLVQFLLALLVVSYRGRQDLINFPKHLRSGRRYGLIGAGIGVILIFFVFPALGNYRLSIQRGATPLTAAMALPADLATINVSSGGLNLDSDFLWYPRDALLYATDRLHGFDSLLVASQGSGFGGVPLNLRSMALSPLGLVIPVAVWAPDQTDVGLLFAHDFWGLPDRDITRIAITVFAEAGLALGPFAVLATAFVLGLASRLATSLVYGPAGHAALGYVFLITCLSFERDILDVIVTTERRLLFVFLVLLITAAPVERRRRRQVRPSFEYVA